MSLCVGRYNKGNICPGPALPNRLNVIKSIFPLHPLAEATGAECLILSLA